MDTSKEYIKMCERAAEIQKLWIVKEADVVFGDRWPGYICAMGHMENFSIRPFNNKCHTGKWAWYQKEEVVWLPRQDQLQEMVIEKETPAGYFIAEELYNDITDSYGRDKYWDFDTMEKFWLAYVMKENFNKIWNGEDWING